MKRRVQLSTLEAVSAVAAAQAEAIVALTEELASECGTVDLIIGTSPEVQRFPEGGGWPLPRALDVTLFPPRHKDSREALHAATVARVEELERIVKERTRGMQINAFRMKLLMSWAPPSVIEIVQEIECADVIDVERALQTNSIEKETFPLLSGHAATTRAARARALRRPKVSKSAPSKTLPLASLATRPR